MQFLAFLKDSYREAKSGWMLQVMLVLAVLLVVLVASVGFRPANPQDYLSSPLRIISWAFRQDPAGFERIGKPEFAIENVVASNKSELWRSDYTFDFVVRTPSPEDMRKARKSGLPTTAPQIRNMLRGSLRNYYKSVELEEPSPPPEAAAFMAAGGGLVAADPPWAVPEVRYKVTASDSLVDDPLAWPHQVSVLFAFDIPNLYWPLRMGVYNIEKWMVSKGGGLLALLVALVVTAGFIPNTLARGSFDLLASKPIGRTTLLMYKYIGGLTFIFVLTTVTVLGIWLVVGLRTGLWSLDFLTVIPLLTFHFAIFYAISTFAAVFTRSALLAILLTVMAWGLFWGIGKVHDGILNREEALAAGPMLAPPDPDDPDSQDPDRLLSRLDPDAPLWGFIPKSTFPVFKALYTISPRAFELDERQSHLIAKGVLTPNQLKQHGYDKPPRESWGEILGVSLAFIAVLLVLSCWRFNSRDY
jgi:ABC-type transport system involved in multi-copper enzyme maturation permease subunit